MSDEGWIWYYYQQEQEEENRKRKEEAEEEQEEEQRLNEIYRGYRSPHFSYSNYPNRNKTVQQEPVPITRVEGYPRLLKSLIVAGAILGIIVGLYIGGLFFILFFGIFGMLGLPFVAHLTFSHKILGENSWLVGAILGFMQGSVLLGAFAGAFSNPVYDINWASMVIGGIIGGVPGAIVGLAIGAQSE
jgi:hypothetical protein